MVTTTDNKIETIKKRIINGNEYCNNLWQQARKVAENSNEYNKIMDELTLYTSKLRELVQMIKFCGYSECCYGACKWDDINFICFGCTETNPDGK